MCNKVHPIIESRINDIKDLLGLTGDTSYGMAFNYLCLKTLEPELDYGDFSQYITDGTDDCGIDIAFLNESEDEDEDEKKAELILIQCTITPELSTVKLNNFLGNSKILFHDYEELKVNKLLNSIIDKAKGYSKKDRLDIKCYYYFNGSLDYTNKNFVDRLTPIKNLYNQYFSEIEICDKDFLLKKLRRTTDKEFETILKIFPSSSDEPKDAIITCNPRENLTTFGFQLKVSELMLLLEDYKDKIGSLDPLFKKNIRNYLGLKASKINKAMLNTIKNEDERKYFSIFNNGVTIICDKAGRGSTIQSNANGYRSLTLTNPNIINGLQTTMTLYYAWNNNILPKDTPMEVFVRVHQVSDEHLIKCIITATNSQSPIDYLDQVSNADFNLDIERYLKDKGYTYLRKNSENRASSAKKEISPKQLLKIWYALYEPSKARTNTTKEVYKKIYETMINDSNDKLFIECFKNIHNGRLLKESYYALIISQIVKIVQLSTKDIYPFVLYAGEHLIYITYNVLKNTNKLNYLDDFEKNKETLALICIDNLNKLVSSIGEEAFSEIYFKNSSNVLRIKEIFVF